MARPDAEGADDETEDEAGALGHGPLDSSSRPLCLRRSSLADDDDREVVGEVDAGELAGVLCDRGGE